MKYLTHIKNFLYKDRYIIIASVIIGIAFTIVYSSYTFGEKTVQDIADKVIRFHVIANSDDPNDQALKRAVRDEILKVMAPKLKKSKSLQQSREILKINTTLMIQIAQRTIQKWGKEYTVEANLTQSFFPTKRYGDVVLPAGEYEAMKVVIGKGKGQNWWCVMFPPLCFVDATHGTIPEESKDSLEKAIGNKEQYEILLTKQQEQKSSVEIKFKVVEMWQNYKHNKKAKKQSKPQEKNVNNNQNGKENVISKEKNSKSSKLMAEKGEQYSFLED